MNHMLINKGLVIIVDFGQTVFVPFWEALEDFVDLIADCTPANMWF